VKQNTAIPPTRGPTDDATREAERPHLRGNVHYIPTEFETRLRMLVAWEARQQARQAVIRRLKAEGKVRVSVMSRAEITRLANEHLRRNATELLAAAERSGVVQNLRLAHERRAVDAQAELLCTSQVQNGEPK
jgi:hypothetical protein